MDTEVLETNEIIIPKELNEYLESDNAFIAKYAEKVNEVNNRLSDLSKERDEKEKEFERRLEEFKRSLEEEIKESDKLFNDREKELNDEKAKIESVKSEEESKKERYIELLTSISDKFNSKISSIKTAIEVASDNDSLKKALEEEQNKLKEALDNESENRKSELNNALNLIGINSEEKVESSKKEIKIEEETKDSFNEEEYNKFMDILNSEIDRIEKTKETNYDTEVIMHESREDVINDIYGSEEVMEGHVFPYLNGLIGE